MTEGEILKEAQDRLALAVEAEGANRDQALTAIKFRNGEQWETRVKQERETDMRPCLTVNMTDTMVRRVVNACRQNRPRIKVHPAGDGADKQLSEVMDGLIRHIEYTSSADVAYDNGVECAITSGWGYLRVGAEYLDEKSFDQDLKICRVRNPFTIYADPGSQTVDGSDYQWVIVSEMMARNEYKARFGEMDPGGWQFLGAGDTLSDWSNKEQIRVAEYWKVELKADTLYRLSDGSSKLKSELPSKDGMAAAGLMVVDKRDTMVKQVRWYLMTAHKILDKRDWKGKFIPIVPVYGREMDLNGKVSRKGMVKDLEDPARILNFAETAKAESYGLQPKAPWMGPEGSIEGHESAWRDANRKPIAFLPYKPTLGSNGEMLPPPERQNPPPVAEGFEQWAEGARSNFLAVAGMPNDPGQDAKGEVVSGVAIRKRQGLSDTSHFDFYDNLTRSLRQVGAILVDLIPHYYDAPRMIRIVKEDGTPDNVQINQQQMDPVTQAVGKIKNDLTIGRYEIVIDTGPSYQTKREESTESLMELIGTPELGKMVSSSAGDLVVRGMDFPNSNAVADRLVSLIPAAQQDVPNDLPPQARALVAGLQGQVQQLKQQLQQAGIEIKVKQGIVQMQEQAKTQRDQMWIASEEKREQAKLSTSLTETHADNTTKRDVAEIGAAAQLLNTHAEAAHDRAAARELIKHGDQAEK